MISFQIQRPVARVYVADRDEGSARFDEYCIVDPPATSHSGGHERELNACQVANPRWVDRRPHKTPRKRWQRG